MLSKTSSDCIKTLSKICPDTLGNLEAFIEGLHLKAVYEAAQKSLLTDRPDLKYHEFYVKKEAHRLFAKELNVPHGFNTYLFVISDDKTHAAVLADRSDFSTVGLSVIIGEKRICEIYKDFKGLFESSGEHYFGGEAS